MSQGGGARSLFKVLIGLGGDSDIARDAGGMAMSAGAA